jgi:hypothetical protein
MKKICNTCKVEKSLDDFNNNKRTKDGKTYNCKTCVKEYNAETRVNPSSRRNRWGSGIYALVHKATCSIHYVGQTDKLYNRKTDHFTGTKDNSVLFRNNLNPNDYEFAILNIIKNKEQRIKHEKLYIDILQPILNKNLTKS